MTEFITTFPSDVTNAAYVKNLCTVAFDGTESTVTSTGADSRYQRVVDTGNPIAGSRVYFLCHSKETCSRNCYRCKVTYLRCWFWRYTH